MAVLMRSLTRVLLVIAAIVIAPTLAAAQGTVAQLGAISSTGTLQSGATANGNGTAMSVDGYAILVVTANCLTCSGGTTINFELSDGTNFTAARAILVGTTAVATSTTTSGLTIWTVPVAGFKSARARISSYSAGTVTVTGTAVPVAGAQTVVEVGNIPHVIVDTAPTTAVTNVGTFAVQASQSGTWTFQPGNTANTTAWLFAGGKSAGATAGAFNIGTLPCIANASAPSWSEGLQYNCSTTLFGANRVTLMTAAGAAATLSSDATEDSAASTTGPQMMGKAFSSEPSAATAGNAAALTTDLARKLVTSPYAVSDLLVSGTTSAMTGTTSTSLIAAPAAGLRNYITQITCGNSHATVGTFVSVQDGSGGTTFYTVPAGAVFGGAAISFPAPLRQPTTATAIFVADVTTGANVICSASGYKGR